MKRILLSQSQVSVALTAAVIATFTLLLFLSGYIIQQRTVSNLQTALRPRIPKPPAALQVKTADHHGPSELEIPSRLFSGNDGKIAYTNLEAIEHAKRSVDWNRLAHVQIARTHHDVCNAIMVLAELHKQKSPARRLLLFPQDWAMEEEGRKKDALSDPFMASSRRLMRMAARRYAVELRPVLPVIQGLREGEAGDGVYSLVSGFGLTDFDRLLSIETPGLILDGTSLDAVLGFTDFGDGVDFGMLQDSKKGDGVHSADLLLLKPSKATHDSLVGRLATERSFNDTLLPLLFPRPLLLASTTDDHTLIRSIGLLHNYDGRHHTQGQDHVFNATAYLENVSYIRFSDPKLPGPEYDVPWSRKREARPKDKEADWSWTKLYGQFAQARMDVCGLDLETWREWRDGHTP